MKATLSKSRLKPRASSEATVTESGAERAKRSEIVCALALGFFSQFDIIPVGTPLQRLTEILAIPFIFFGIARANADRLMHRYIFVPLLVTAITISKMTTGQLSFSFGNNNGDFATLLIYVIYLLASPGLLSLIRKPSTMRAYCLGIIVGGIGGVIVIVLQGLGFSDRLVSIGLSEAGRVVQVAGDVPRLTGLWGHANETGPVMSILAVAAGVFWLLERRILPFFVVVIATICSFFFTLNRSGLIVMLSIIGFSLAFSAPGKLNLTRVVSFCFLLASSYLILLQFPSSPLYQRFLSGDGVGENAGGRSSSTLYGLQMALQHPGGMMLDDWTRELSSVTGFSTPHNGFVSMMLNQGVLLPILLIVAICRAVPAGIRKAASPVDIFMLLTSLQLTGCFMFEQLSFSFPFIMEASLLISWLIIGEASGRSSLLVKTSKVAHSR